jgi:hypothetical protein
MASEIRHFFALVVLATACWLSAETPAGSGEDSETRSFYFRLGPDGSTEFTQLIRWEGDPYALAYRVVVENGSGAVILDQRCAEAELAVHLPPGSYRYRITTYNLLDKAEGESDWTAIEVIKAEQPAITAVSPRTIYMDTLDGQITVTGTSLLDKADYSLVTADGKRYAGTVTQRSGDGQVVLVFPDEAYRSGSHAIRVENPGGLSATLDDAVTVRFQRPVDLLFSAGYSPFVSLVDQWFVDNWTPRYHALGFSTLLELFFIKQNWGLMGLELDAEYAQMKGGTSRSVLTSDFVLVGLDLLYKYRFSRQVHGLVRLGGGVAWSYHSFDYENYKGPATSSWDPFARLGLAVQVFLPSKFYGEIGADCTGFFLLNHFVFGITPRVSVGYQFF